MSKQEYKYRTLSIARVAAGRKYVDKCTERLRAWKAQPCMDCGGSFPAECMDFDHVRGEKLFNVGSRRTGSLVALEAEIAKCDLVCANCHRIRTRDRKLAVAS